MRKEIDGRVVLFCDRCHARLDMGIVKPVNSIQRSPSGWLSTGENQHACGLCAPSVMGEFNPRN